MGPLVVVCVVFLAVSAPPYFAFDHTRPPIEFRPGIEPVHYSLVALHVAFGTIALLACCLQVWPKLRERLPFLHRWVGRGYVFVGVLPSGFLGIVVALLHTQGLNAQIGNVVLCALWLYTTWAGYRAGQARRFADHRAWMIRSFALCTSIVANRLWVGISIVLASLDSTYDSEQAMLQSGIGAGVWLSWVVNLLIAEWWLQYRGKKPLRREPAGSRTRSSGGATSASDSSESVMATVPIDTGASHGPSAPSETQTPSSQA